jgi:hypothetical protein
MISDEIILETKIFIVAVKRERQLDIKQLLPGQGILQ